MEREFGEPRLLPVRRTFVLQLYSDADPEQGRFSGRVEHVSSGDTIHFEALPDLVAFIARTLTAA